MFFQVSIQPDELAESYFGRVLRINAISDKKSALTLFSKYFRFDEDNDRPIFHIEYLSRIAQLDIPDFVCRHTTLPFRRAIASYAAQIPHGVDDGKSMLRLSAGRDSRPEAYFCKQCIKIQQKETGMPFWRRVHQIPGMMICQEHRIPLFYTKEKNAFLRSPTDFLRSHIAIENMWAKNVHKNKYVERFVEIAEKLLDLKLPAEVKKVRVILRKRADERGLSIKNGECERPLISDEILTKFPRDWLATVFPDLLQKRFGEKMHRSDGVVYLSTAASSVDVYILAFSVLFDTSDEVVSVIKNSQKLKITPKRKVSDINGDELRLAYLAAKGRYSDIVIESSEGRWNIKNKLISMGLPNLKQGLNYDYFKSLYAFYCKACSVEESAKVGGISMKELEDCVRVVGTDFISMLDRMTSFGPPKKGTRRTKSLSPSEVAQLTGT